jgi:acyl dehydratase
MTEPTIQVGEWYGPYEGRIDHDAALAYALATDDPNAASREGRAVPPLYTVSLVLPARHTAEVESVPAGAIAGVRGGVHGLHDLVVHHPLAPGADVTWRVTPHCAQQTSAGVLIAQRIVVSDADGPAVEHFWTTLYMGGTIPQSLGPPLADHTFPDPAREHPVGTHVFDVTRDQAFRYGGASGDRAPMHIDDEAARRAGFPSKFMQGLCTFAMCSGAVVKLAADGDPDRIRRLACRFSAPVFPGNSIAVDVYDAGENEDGTHAFAFEATSAGKTVIKHGRANVA